MKSLNIINIGLMIILNCLSFSLFSQEMEIDVDHDDDGRLEVWILEPFGGGCDNPAGCWVLISEEAGDSNEGGNDNGDINGDHDEYGDADPDHDGDYDEDGDIDVFDDFWDDYWHDPWEDWEWYDDDSWAGTGTDPQEKKCPELSSRTHKVPKRERRIIGIGEEVDIRIKNRCGEVRWEIEGPGEITGGSNSECSIMAHWTAGKIKVKAIIYDVNQNCSTCPKSLVIEFDVITPTGIYFDNFAQEPHCPDIYHYKYRPSCGYSADSYFMPDNVNFYNNQIKEDFVEGEADGDYFSGTSIIIPPHMANAYVECTERVVPGKGTKISIADDLYSEFVCRTIINPNLYGRIDWDIPNRYYNRCDFTDVYFTNTLQSATNIGGIDNPEFTLQKENSSNSTHLLDPDHCTTGPNSCN